MSGIPISNNFPVSCDPPVKGFGVVDKAEIVVFCKSRFFYAPTDVGNLSSGSSDFPASYLDIWKFSVQVLLKPGLGNFEHLLVYEISTIVQ